MGSDASKPGDYVEPELPEGVLELRASVYKLKLTGASILDEIGSGLLQAFHTGIVVGGDEWAYGGHDEVGYSGVYRCKPEQNEQYIFYQRLVLGRINRDKKQVATEITMFAAQPQWAGTAYDLTGHNCNHFASDLCWLLLKKRLPEWINATADGIDQNRRVNASYKHHAHEARSAYCTIMTGVSDLPESHPELPGEPAFKSTFETTFFTAWERGWKDNKNYASTCPEGEDPEALKNQLEKSILEFAAEAGQAAAFAVAAGARRAREAREKLIDSGRPGVAAWDDAWKNASGPLVKQWREDALAGSLKLNDALSEFTSPGESDSGRKRLDQVEQAIAVASAAAQKAAIEAASATEADPSLEGFHQ